MTLSINLEELGVTGQSAPAVAIKVLSRLLSRNTPFIASASYTLRSIHSCTEAVVAMSWSPSLSPDAAIVRLERWQALTPEQRRGFPTLCPDLVVETWWWSW